jgi:hypothetical protein
MSCCNCTIITQTDFYGIVPLSKNVESENIDIAINNSRATYMNDLLCQALFDELCEQISTNTLTNSNEELLCRLKKVMVCYAFADLMFFHPVQVTKESVVRKVTEESEFVDFDTNEKQAMYWRQIGKNYANEMFSWLKLNINLNPLYNQELCNDCNDKKDLEYWGIS